MLFLPIDEAAADGLLAQQEQQSLDDLALAAFAAQRRLAALLCGLVFAGLVPDLSLLPASAPSWSAFYAELRAGTLDLRDARGLAAFALALLQLGTAGGAALPGRTAT